MCFRRGRSYHVAQQAIFEFGSVGVLESDVGHVCDLIGDSCWRKRFARLLSSSVSSEASYSHTIERSTVRVDLREVLWLHERDGMQDDKLESHKRDKLAWPLAQRSNISASSYSRLSSRHSCPLYFVVLLVSSSLNIRALTYRTLSYDDSPSALAVEQLNDSAYVRDARSLCTQFHLGGADCICDICPRSSPRDPDLHLASVFLHRFYTLSGSRLDIHTSQHPCAAAELEEVRNPRSVELKLP
ncbi:hypothetical protein KCU62_g9568, partial [Aureobasidium sp. EXF-3399]